MKNVSKSENNYICLDPAIFYQVLDKIYFTKKSLAIFGTLQKKLIYHSISCTIYKHNRIGSKHNNNFIIKQIPNNNLIVYVDHYMFDQARLCLAR